MVDEKGNIADGNVDYNSEEDDADEDDPFSQKD